MSDLIARALAGDRETYGETVLVCNGSPRVIAWSDTIARDEHGAIVGTTSIGQDVTDRRRAQTRLALQVEVAHVLASATTLEEAAHEVLAALVRAVSGCAGALWVVDRDVLRIGGTFQLPDDPAAEAIAATWRGAGAGARAGRRRRRAGLVRGAARALRRSQGHGLPGGARPTARCWRCWSS